MAKSKRTEKQCPDCNATKPLAEFVTVYGYDNPRGKYCRDCFRKQQQQHVMSLMDGRDFCLYCGVKVERYCDYSPEGNSIKNYVHQDHMDPRSKGGHDMYGVVDYETGEVLWDSGNLVYCCAECNIAKGSMPFIDWLKTLKTENQKLARAVYAEKHDGKSPEEFVPKEDIIFRIEFDPKLFE